MKIEQNISVDQSDLNQQKEKTLISQKDITIKSVALPKIPNELSPNELANFVPSLNAKVDKIQAENLLKSSIDAVPLNVDEIDDDEAALALLLEEEELSRHTKEELKAQEEALEKLEIQEEEIDVEEEDDIDNNNVSPELEAGQQASQVVPSEKNAIIAQVAQQRFGEENNVPPSDMANSPKPMAMLDARMHGSSRSPERRENRSPGADFGIRNPIATPSRSHTSTQQREIHKIKAEIMKYSFKDKSGELFKIILAQSIDRCVEMGKSPDEIKKELNFLIDEYFSPTSDKVWEAYDPKQNKVIRFVQVANDDQKKQLRTNQPNKIIHNENEVDLVVFYLDEHLRKEITEYLNFVRESINNLNLGLHSNIEGKEKSKNITTNSIDQTEKAKLKSKDSDIPKIINEIKKHFIQNYLADDLIEMTRKWDKKMMDDFIQQLEKEFKINKEEIKKIIANELKKRAELIHEEKEESALVKPVHLSRFNNFVNQLYEYLEQMPYEPSQSR